MSFTTLTLRFFANDNLFFKYFSGYYVRGFFYSTLKKIDSNLAEKIHNSKTLSPFSSKALTVEQKNYKHVILRRIDRHSLVSFSYSIFSPEVSRKFIELVVQDGVVTFLDKRFDLNSVSLREVKWSDLVESSKPVRRFDLVFLSPTYFRLPPTLLERYEARLKVVYKKEKASYRYYPLPDPSLLIRSVTKIWKTFSPVKLNLAGLISWVGAGGVAISGFQDGIRTFRLYEHEKANKWVVGFTGRVGYSIPNDLFNENFARNLDALLKFSQFSNVGGGRTAGLGMVEYIPLEYAEESKS